MSSCAIIWVSDRKGSVILKDISVVIVAAGTGSRMGGVDKQLLPLGDKPVLMHSVHLFGSMDCVSEIVVVTRAELVHPIMKLLEQANLSIPFQVVLGGDTRQASVFTGVTSCQGEQLVAIHDAARPLLTVEDANRVFADARQKQAATLGVLVKDTIKIVNQDKRIASTPSRESLYSIQTPQVFDKQLYLTAYNEAKNTGKDYTDDCQLIEAIGHPVYVTNGSYQNIKITTAEDISLANAFWKEQQQ